MSEDTEGLKLLCSKTTTRPGVVDDPPVFKYNTDRQKNIMLTGRKQVLHKVFLDLSRRSFVLAVEIHGL